MADIILNAAAIPDDLAEYFEPLNVGNKSDVFSVATQPYAEAHFATFPPKLIEPCILAGTSEKGACPACGAPWVRVVERDNPRASDDYRARATTPKDAASGGLAGRGTATSGLAKPGWRKDGAAVSTTTGWQPSCTCDAGEPVPCVVLDPFMGSGTTALVAQKHGRKALGIDINSEYLDMAIKRNAQKTLWFQEAS